MRWSYVRLVVTSVLVVWALSFVALVVYSQTRTWDEARARRDGVFHVHDLLTTVAPEARAARLARLQPHFRVPLRLADADELVRQLDRPPAPGPEAWHHERGQDEWWVVPFDPDERSRGARTPRPAR